MADNATTPTNETAPADAAAREQAIRELTLAEVKKVKESQRPKVPFWRTAESRREGNAVAVATRVQVPQDSSCDCPQA